MTDRRALSHLLRRLTFGPTSAEVDAAARAGCDATLTGLLRPAPLPSPPALGAYPFARLPPGAGREQRPDILPGLEIPRQRQKALTHTTIIQNVNDLGMG